MTVDEYIECRLEDQILWYSRKSQWNQHWYKRLRVAEIVFASSIPFLAGYTETSSYARAVIGLAGVIVAIITSTASLFKLQENWIQYRTTTESLKHEKFLYLTASAPYDGADGFHLLVERTEALISKENTNWSCYATKDHSKEACKT